MKTLERICFTTKYPYLCRKFCSNSEILKILLSLLFSLLTTFHIKAQAALDTVVTLSTADTTFVKLPDGDEDEKTFIPPPPTKKQTEYENTDIKQHNFDKNKWHDLTKDLDYSVETDKTRKEKKNSGSWLTGDQIKVLLELFVAFFWISVAAFILFLIYQIANNGNVFFRRSKKITNSSDASTIHIDEEDIQNNDFDALIRRATAQKNYVLAVRLYYMAILKELDAKGDIKWEKEKTNSRYLSEMKKHDLLVPFKNCTHLFDTYFYGQRALDETVFTGIQSEFQNLLEKTKTNLP